MIISGRMPTSEQFFASYTRRMAFDVSLTHEQIRYIDYLSKSPNHRMGDVIDRQEALTIRQLVKKGLVGFGPEQPVALTEIGRLFYQILCRSHHIEKLTKKEKCRGRS